jgi:endonuclease III
MSEKTAELLEVVRRFRKLSKWTALLEAVTDTLVGAYGVPRLGNFRDTVREIFYILLSAKTTDGQYRRTFRALADRFPSLSALAEADEGDILACIESGGLANKRASQIKRTAAALIAGGGEDPAAAMRKMAPRELFDFLTGLPGIGPKSALCVMMYSLDHDVFPVDVNVQRVAERLGIIPFGLKHY